MSKQNKQFQSANAFTEINLIQKDDSKGRKVLIWFLRSEKTMETSKQIFLNTLMITVNLNRLSRKVCVRETDDNL